MAKKIVTLEEVSAVCERLVAEGVTPTTSAVYKAIGKGSLTTIQRFTREWLAEAEGKVVDSQQIEFDELPTSFHALAINLIKKIYVQAQQEHASSLALAEKEKAAAIKDAEEKISEANDIADDIASENEELRNRVSALETEISNLHAQQQKKDEQGAATLKSLIEAHAGAVASKDKTISLLEAKVDQLESSTTQATKVQLYPELAELEDRSDGCAKG